MLESLEPCACTELGAFFRRLAGISDSVRGQKIPARTSPPHFRSAEDASCGISHGVRRRNIPPLPKADACGIFFSLRLTLRGFRRPSVSRVAVSALLNTSSETDPFEVPDPYLRVRGSCSSLTRDGDVRSAHCQANISGGDDRSAKRYDRPP